MADQFDVLVMGTLGEVVAQTLAGTAPLPMLQVVFRIDAADDGCQAERSRDGERRACGPSGNGVVTRRGSGLMSAS